MDGSPSWALVRDVLVAGLDQDGLALDEVAHRDLAPLDARERGGAGVLHEPFGAADRRRAERALGAEPPLAVAPQAPLLLLLLGRRRLLRRALAAELLNECQCRDRRLALALRELEQAVEEVGLGEAARLVRRRREADAALARVDDRPVRELLALVQDDELALAAELDLDQAALGLGVDQLAD